MALNFRKRCSRDLDRSEGTQMQIASVREGNLEINKKVLENILLKPQWKDERVMVLSIAGIFQSGKSFLLNLLIRYLSQNCTDSWMDDQESKVDRFDWSDNKGTSGIWMWSKVFYILGSDGRKFGVLLMDTQGTPDPYSATNEDALLFALSTLLSSVQIYNLKSDINDADLQFLQQVVRYGTAGTAVKDKEPFQSLLFLIRGWQNQRECNFGKDGGTKRLRKCVDKNQDLKTTIHQVFVNLRCFLMPHPVEDTWDTSICHVKDIAKTFLVEMKGLLKILFSSAISEVKQIDGDDITCARLLDYFQLYEKTLNKVKFEIASKTEPRRQYLHHDGSGRGGARASAVAASVKATETATVVTKIGNNDSVYRPTYDERFESEFKPGLVDGHAVQIVAIKNNELELYEDRLESILKQPRLKDIPVMVLSVAGLFRAGKSFLLNLLIKYFSHGCSPNWMDDQESTLNGFIWKSGAERVTTGVWMWSEVFITGPANRKFAVILIDTQGTQDPYSSTRENASIFALSTLLSSVQIYNVKYDINEADLQFLQLFVGYGIAVKNDKKPFQKLLFLIRDWSNPNQYQFGRDGGTKRLKKCMEIHPKQSRENVDLRKSIHEVFDTIMCFLMPRPGDEIVEGESGGQFRHIGARFQVQMKELIRLLFLSDVPELKRIDGKDMTCESLFDYVKRYMKIITKGNMFEIASIAEANSVAHARKSLFEVIRDFEKEMDEVCKIYQENIDEIYEKKKKQTVEDFKIKCDFSRTVKYEELEGILKEEIKSKMMKYIAVNNLMEATARTENQKHFEEALTMFDTKMNEKCLLYMDTSELKSEFEGQKSKAIDKFKKKGKQVGTSYSECIEKLEEDIPEKYSVYQSKMIDFKNEAYKLASETYECRMDQIYEVYQEPEDLMENHEEARQEALEEFSRNAGEMTDTQSRNFKDEMLLKRTECHKLNAQKNENAKRKNNAAYDFALVYYRSIMENDCLGIGLEGLHKRSQREVMVKYNDKADEGFPSFETNKEDLQTAIEDIMEEYRRKKRRSKGKKNFIRRAIFNIPERLLKAVFQ